jgi:ribosomal-protein-alanine N-acetyltransferase
VSPKLDLAAMAALHAEAFLRPRPWSAGEFAAVLAGPGAFLLTEAGGFLVGRALAGEAELLTLAVPVAARRQGIGTRLLRAFEAEALARGSVAAFLEVASDNGPARALYAEADWSEAGRRRDYYAPGVDALVLRKWLVV